MDWMAWLVVFCILGLGLAGAIFLMSRSKDNRGLTEKVEVQELRIEALEESLKKNKEDDDALALAFKIRDQNVAKLTDELELAKRDIQTVFDEHTKKLSKIENKKAEHITVHHDFGKMIPFQIVYSRAETKSPHKETQDNKGTKKLIDGAGVPKSYKESGLGHAIGSTKTQ